MGWIGFTTNPSITVLPGPDVSRLVNRTRRASRFIFSVVRDFSWTRARIMAHQPRTSGQNICIRNIKKVWRQKSTAA